MNIPSTRTGILITSYCRLLVKDCKKGVIRKEKEKMEQIEAELFNRDILRREDIDYLHLI